MEEEKSQKELFEFKEPKKPFSKLANMLPKPDFEGKVAVILTLEKIVFISIAIIMVMVLVFALGVETGKSRSRTSRQVTQKAPRLQGTGRAAHIAAPVAAIQPPVAAAKNFFSTAPAVPSARTPVQKVPAAPVKAVSPAESPKPYTIVAATFSKLETAQAAMAFLRKEGFNAYISYADPYYRVCVGSYADASGAQSQRDLAKVKRIYADAFMKLR